MSKINYPLIFSLAALAASIGPVVRPSIEELQVLLLRPSLAGVASLELQLVRTWQKQRGLRQDLGLGDLHPEVKLLQEALSEYPDIYPRGIVTGFFGEATLEALKKFQQKQNLAVTGEVDKKTRERINEIYFAELCPSGSHNQPDMRLIRLTKKSGLPYGYVPKDLVDISDKVKTFSIICLQKEAAQYLETMFQAATGEGIHLAVTSGFRRVEIQKLLYINWIRLNGRQALDYVAPPGFSEHQLGTTVDLTGETLNYRPVEPAFGRSKEGRWLEVNAHRYGFVLSYPPGKKAITGYEYEPWHFRFVGREVARELYEEDLTLVEYAQR